MNIDCGALSLPKSFMWIIKKAVTILVEGFGGEGACPENKSTDMF